MKLGRFLVNFGHSIVESDSSSTLPPLDDGLGSRVSDHQIVVAFFKANVKKVKQTIVQYRYRQYIQEEGAARFQTWAETHDFGEVFELQDVNAKLGLFLNQLEKTMDLCFPYRTTRRRESDPPWINKHSQEAGSNIFHRVGRSPRWKELMKLVIKLSTGNTRRGPCYSLTQLELSLRMPRPKAA